MHFTDGRDEGKLAALATSIHASAGADVKDRLHLIKADLSAPNEAKKIVLEVTQKMGGIDVLINNAGVLDSIAFENQSEQRIAEMIHTSVTALIQLTNAALLAMQANNTGHFLFVGSIFGSLGFPHFATYCASKFAVHGFSQSLRCERVNTNIGITYIAPRLANMGLKKQTALAAPFLSKK